MLYRAAEQGGFLTQSVKKGGIFLQNLDLPKSVKKPKSGKFPHKFMHKCSKTVEYTTQKKEKIYSRIEL